MKKKFIDDEDLLVENTNKIKNKRHHVKITKLVNLTLTPHQSAIKDDILRLLYSGAKRIILNGSAGVGKTTCVNYIISEFCKKIISKDGGNINILAPTNKAVSVLKSKSDSCIFYDFRTVHQALNLKRVISEIDGTISFTSSYSGNNKLFKDTKLIIVDEASMLNEELIDQLEKYDIPIIYIGDVAQLPPVGEIESKIFTKKYPVFQLTEIIRQAKDNPIIDLSRKLTSISKREDNITDAGVGYRYIDEKTLMDVIFEDIENTKFLAWTNSEVNKRNSSIRQRRYGSNANLIEMGEIIIMKEPYSDLFTSQEVKIEKLEETNKFINIVFNGSKSRDKKNIHKKVLIGTFKCYVVNGYIPFIHEESIHHFEKTKKEIIGLIKEGIATWTNYYDFVDYFAYFDYSYAITVHKSQGSTYKNVIIDYKDLLKNRKPIESKKLWYTAITRASDLLYFFI